MPGPGEEIGTRIAQEMTFWSSIEIHVNHSLEVYIPIAGLPIPSKPVNRFEEHYVETSKNMRIFDTKLYHDEELRGRYTGYCDGKRCARVDYVDGSLTQQSKVTISTAFLGEGQSAISERPVPLQYYFVGPVPLYEALPRAEYLGSLRFLGRACEKFLFRDQRWAQVVQNIVYTLDAETGIPLKVESFTDASSLEKDDARWRWITRDFRQREGHYLAVDSEQRTFGKPGSIDEGKELRRHRFQVEKITYNQSYPGSMFWHEEKQKDVVFVDSIARKTEFPRANPNEPHLVESTTAVAQPLRAVPPSEGATTISWVLLIAGLGVLFAGALLYWRRR